MSDTPRTDMVEMRRLTTGHINGRVFQTEERVVPVEEMAKLERENNQLRAQLAEAQQRIAKQNTTIDLLNQCGADTHRLDWLNRVCFDVTESNGRWCVMDYIDEKAHYGKTVRDAIDKAFQA